MTSGSAIGLATDSARSPAERILVLSQLYQYTNLKVQLIDEMCDFYFDVYYVKLTYYYSKFTSF